MAEIKCLCLSCVDEIRLGPKQYGKSAEAQSRFGWSGDWGTFRYACDICNNKNCPHHSDHKLACTNSNQYGQTGSQYR